MSNTQPKPGDKGAAYTGLLVSAIAIFVILFGVSKWTSSRFADHAPAAGAPAATTGH